MEKKIIKVLKQSKFLRSILHVFSGTVISSILSLLNTALLVKAIGLEKNGIIFLGLSYSNFFNTLFNFQSYEAIIKFMPNYLEEKTKKTIDLIHHGLIIDMVTAILAFVFSNLFLNKAFEYFKWNIEIKNYIYIFNFTILFNITGTFTGILRIFNKFKEISKINIYTSLFNTVFYLIGILIKAKMLYYVLIIVLNLLFNNLIMMYYTLKTLRKNNFNINQKINYIINKEFLEFVIYTNLSSTLDLPIFQLTPFIINKYLGLTEIAVYKILEKLGSIITKVSSVIGQVLMPEISSLLAKNKKKEAKKLVLKIGIIMLILGVLGLIFLKFTNSYWLNYFLPGYENYLSSVYLYFGFVIFTQCFMGQWILFTFDGYLKYNIPILIFVNTLYLLMLIFMIRKLGLNGLILLRIFQAGIIYLIKGIIMKLGERNEAIIKE